MPRTSSRRAGLLAVTALAAALAAAPVGAQSQSRDQDRARDQTQPQDRIRAPDAWSAQAERAFGLGRGLGPRLMTRQEWEEHQRTMRGMTTEERERYRAEVHARMQTRAKEQGLTLPDVPRSGTPGQPGAGMGPGPGMGPGGGMGPAGGMGPGGGAAGGPPGSGPGGAAPGKR